MFSQNTSHQDESHNNAQTFTPAPGSAGPIDHSRSPVPDPYVPAPPKHAAPSHNDTPAPAAHQSPKQAQAHGDDLLDIKQHALHELTPLVDQLEQSPEEKFRTTMMMIQASDDQSLVKIAYEAARNISDEKARAQALLDVVNEINYFTQQH